MAFVFGVMACSTAPGSRLREPTSTSTYTGVAPRKANALAVDTNVNDGMMISSPGPAPMSKAACSRAAVAECVSRAEPHFNVLHSHASQALVCVPRLSKALDWMTDTMLSSSLPVQ